MTEVMELKILEMLKEMNENLKNIKDTIQETSDEIHTIRGYLQETIRVEIEK